MPPCPLTGRNAMMRKLGAAFVAALVVLSAFVLTAPAQARGPAHRLRPIVFVHGFFGSGSQYETPARRFASNGYPSTYVEAHEYHSTFATTTVPAVHAALDA